MTEHTVTISESRFAELITRSARLDVLESTFQEERGRRNIEEHVLREEAELGRLVRKLPQGYHLKHCELIDSWSCHNGFSEMATNERKTPEEAIKAALQTVQGSRNDPTKSG